MTTKLEKEYTTLPKDHIERMEYTQISLDEITFKHKSKLLHTKAPIQRIIESKPQLTRITLQCTYCGMLTKDIRPETYKKLNLKKEECKRCGHRGHLKKNLTQSDYKYHQKFIIAHESELRCEIYSDTNDVLLLREGYDVEVKGILEVEIYRDTPYLLLNVHSIKCCGKSKEIPTNKKRDSAQQRKWAEKIKARDRHCLICGGHKHLDAHHLFNYKNYPELRWKMGNGVTLCTFCHQRFHSYYGKQVTPSDLIHHIHNLHGGGV